MAAGSGKPSTGIEQGEGLGQTVGAKSLTRAFLTGEQGVTAIHTARDSRIGFQLRKKTFCRLGIKLRLVPMDK